MSRLPLENNVIDVGPIAFHIPRAGTAYGYPAEDVITICQAYESALVNDRLREDQIHIGKHCVKILSACGKVSLVALIDEATGYQQLRAIDALQVKITAYMREDLRLWEARFPEMFWRRIRRVF